MTAIDPQRDLAMDPDAPGTGDGRTEQEHGGNGAVRAANTEPAPAIGRPIVTVNDRQTDEVVDDALAALRAGNHPPELFMRGGAVVSIRRDEDGRPIVAPVSDAGLSERLARDARWVRVVGDKIREAGPSREIAALVGERILRKGDALPALRGVTACPTMRADGSILDRPGYDAATRLYLAPVAPIELPKIPEAPSEMERRTARALLDEMLFDFPVVGDADYAAALSVLVTLLLREMIAGCVPLALFDAPAAGTGKGLLADVIGTAGTGEAPAKMPEPDGRGDDEWRKRLTSMLLEGRGFAVIDNLEKPIGSASLAALLTSGVWSDRALGSNRMVTIANRLVLVATGNNLRLRGDLPRRCVWCRLDARETRPWTRSGFRHPDLLGWVREHRGEILGAVFTLARAWIAAGRPGPGDEVPRLGSFEGWREVVGGILRVAELPGFLGNAEMLYATADEETPAWSGFLSAWRSTFGGDDVTVAVLLERVKQAPHGPLVESLPGEIAEALDKPSAAKRIGRALARKAETRFALDENTTARLTRESDTHRKVIRWRLVEG